MAKSGYIQEGTVKKTLNPLSIGERPPPPRSQAVARSNNPPLTIELSAEMTDFIEEICNANIAFSLQMLDVASTRTAKKIVQMMEKFKELRGIMQAAKPKE